MPEQSEALVLVDGANELSGARALWWVVRRWPRLRGELVSAPGYVAHRLWFSFPLTIGLTTWWRDEKALHRFAHMPVHLEFWEWAVRKGSTRGGWLAIYRYEHGGPLWGNGVKHLMDNFGRFVPPAPEKPPKETPGSRRSTRG